MRAQANKILGALQWTLRDARRSIEARIGEVRAAVRHRLHERQYGDAAPSPYRLVSIEAGDVEHLLEPRFDERLGDHGTYIIGGDWDQTDASRGLMYANRYEGVFEAPRLVPFERYGFYQSAKERFQHGVAWKDTRFYRWCMERIEADEPRSPRFSTTADVEERLALFDTLFREIESKGYRTQRELQQAGDAAYHKAVWPPERHEVKVSIGRDGRIIFDEGQHRFVIAKILDLRIPVRVIVRHREWQQMRVDIHEHPGPPSELEVPVDRAHPDLSDVLDVPST